MPELAIIPMPLWERVHARLKAESARLPRGGWTASATRYQYLLGGLLKCGVCGGPMGVVSARKKKDQRYARFGCTTRHRKGALVCANDLSVSERKLNEAVSGALQNLLLAPGAVEKFTALFGKRLAQRREEVIKGGETARLQKEIAAAEAKLTNLTNAIAHAGWSTALGDSIKREEERLRALKARLADQTDTQHRVHFLPTPLVVADYLKNLLETLQRSPERGRELLRQHIGQLTLIPQKESPSHSYEVTGAFQFLNLLISLGNPKGVRDSFSCGGRI